MLCAEWASLRRDGDYDSIGSALCSMPVHKPGDFKADTVRLRAVVESNPGDGTRHDDEIDSFALCTYLPRYTREIWLEVIVEGEA